MCASWGGEWRTICLYLFVCGEMRAKCIKNKRDMSPAETETTAVVVWRVVVVAGGGCVVGVPVANCLLLLLLMMSDALMP